jgi:hypothetical protein
MAAWLPLPFKEGRVTRTSNWHRMTASLYLGLYRWTESSCILLWRPCVGGLGPVRTCGVPGL